MKGWFGTRKPEVSVVVVVHNMDREAPRTLYSLSAAYQQNIAADEYEVIVVDNGSTPPLDPKIIDGLSGNFRLIRLDPAPPSPAHAINRGLAEARGDIVGVMIDGARMVTPGLLHFARSGVRLYRRAVVVTLGWYLGLDLQRWAIEGGYNQEREDALLASIEWPKDGYRLFEIAALDEPSADGWFGTIGESNILFLSRESWDQLGGVDERFDAPGGGLLNLDTLVRASELPNSEMVVLLGEGTFHQLHGGIVTDANYRTFAQTGAKWAAQYQTIRGRPWEPVQVGHRTHLGMIPPAALAHFARSLIEPVGSPALGPTFDRTLWSHARSPQPADPTLAALVDLANAEFRARRFEAAAAVARITRHHAPDEPAPQRLLAVAGAWLRGSGEPTEINRAGFHLARAKAYRLLGDTAAATAEFRLALTYEPDLPDAHVALSELRMPGPGHLNWLARLHAALAPETYLEIGIGGGQSLACARPPTRAIAVDPEPRIDRQLKIHTQIFCETSDAFFDRDRLTSWLGGKPLSLAFIDGLHTFQQCLRDFMHVEPFCGPTSVVLLHDTVPLDEITQRPDQQRVFYTGDVWKTVLCLKHFRPDLDIFTIAAPWSGLTVIIGLNPSSRILVERYDEAVEQFKALPYASFANRLQEMLCLVPNNWDIVSARLKERNIL